MFKKSRGIAINLALLILIVPFGEPQAAENAEQTVNNTGNGDLAKFVAQAARLLRAQTRLVSLLFSQAISLFYAAEYDLLLGSHCDGLSAGDCGKR